MRARTSAADFTEVPPRRKATPPRRPREYQSRWRRSSRTACSSWASAAWCGRSLARCSICRVTWRITTSTHSSRVGGGGAGSPRSAALSSRKIQGLPQAPRATSTASQPVSARMRRASAAVQTSPEPSTGMPTASLTSRISSQRALPE